MQQNLVTSFEPVELKTMIREALREELSPLISSLQNPTEDPERYLTRKETCKRLNISLGTLATRTVEGKIISHKIGRRILYKVADVDNSLRKRCFRADEGLVKK